MAATPRAAPPIAPARTITQARMSASLFLGLLRRGSDNVIGPLPVDAALGQLAARAVGEHDRLLEVAGIVPEFGGGQVRHRFVLEHAVRSEEHTSELQSHVNLVCRLLLEK